MNTKEILKHFLFKIPVTRRIMLNRIRKSTNNFDFEIWGQNFRDQVEECLEKNVLPEKFRKMKKSSLYITLYDFYLRYGINPGEFFGYGFYNLSAKEREAFAPVQVKDKFLAKVMGGYEKYRELQNKYNLYCRLKDYYKRECFELNEQTINKAMEFAHRHNRFICKPLKGCFGANTFIVDGSTQNDSELMSKFETMVSNGAEWILEELIIQHPETAKWNPDSVNTLRLPIIHNSKGIHIFHPIFRMGRKGSCVDNGGAGGILVAVDPQTGQFISDGHDERGNKYISHPDSNIEIRGGICLIIKAL